MPRFIAILISTIALSSYSINTALAQDTFGINRLTGGAAGNAVNLGSRSLEATIARIINVALGFLGVVAVLIIIYAGFLWMTSKGNVDRIQKAKLILISATIGLVIVLAAAAISRFVLENIIDATGGGGGPIVVIPPVASCPDPGPGVLEICKVSPTSRGIGDWVTIWGWNFEAYAANSEVRLEQGAVQSVAGVVSCGGNISWNQVSPNYYKVTVQVPDVIADGGVLGAYKVRVTGDSGNTDLWPVVGLGLTVTNAAPGPAICNIVPNSGPTGTTVDIFGIRFGPGVAGDTITMDSDLGSNMSVIDFVDPEINSWVDDQINLDIKADAISSSIRVNVAALASNPDYFSVTCTANGNANFAECSTGCCSGLFCQEAAVCAAGGGPAGPVVDSIQPDNGEVGNWITVLGSGFGVAPGQVYFEDANGNQLAGIAPQHAQCAAVDYWQDDYIIVQVPPGTIPAPIVTGQLNVQTAALEDSNAVLFTKNNTVRPGLCKAVPNTGIFEDNVTVYGNNFDDPLFNDVFFGGIDGNNTGVPFNSPNDEVSTDVPNLAAGSLGVQVEVNAEFSNPIPFTVLGTASGDPKILNIDPSPAPEGQYLTIQGANFGNSQGFVKFDPLGLNVNGDFSFPVQCDDSFWRQDRIIVKVPLGLGNSAWDVRVIRNGDNVPSNDYSGFVLDNAAPRKPGICKMDPDNGPAGTTVVNFYGDNFGNIPGLVKFSKPPLQFSEIAVAPAVWNDQQVLGVTVPLTADTGPVIIEDSFTNPSNQLLFSVGSCGDDQYCSDNFGLAQCCPGSGGNFCSNACDPVPNVCQYPWDLSTEAAPFDWLTNQCVPGSGQTPSPWPHGLLGIDSLTNYVDSVMVVNFTRNVENTTLLDPGNFVLWQCTGQGLGCNIAVALDLGQIINGNSSSEGVMYKPSNNLTPNTWYSIDLGQNGGFKAAVGGDFWPIGPPPVWEFKTRANTDTCTPTAAVVTPQNSSVLVGSNRSLTALPVSNSCQVCGQDYDWNWSITTDPTGVNVINPAVNLNTAIGQTTLTGVAPTAKLLPIDRVTVQADVVGFSASGTTDVTVTDAFLKVTNYTPNCSDSCGNASVQVTFNTDIDPSVANLALANWIIDDTSIAGINNITTGLTVLAPNVIQLDHGGLLEGATYEVTISSAVLNTTGYQLNDGLNDHVWTFQTGTNGNCLFNGLDIIPDNYLSTVPNQNITYSGVPLSDPQICGGQPLQCGGAVACSWSWQNSDPGVALITGGNSSPTVFTTNNAGYNAIANLQLDELNSGVVALDTLETDFTIAPPVQLAVLDKWPNCNGSCGNAQIGLRFNMNIFNDPANLVPNLFVSDITGVPVDITTAFHQVIADTVIIGHDPLTLGNTYEVTVKAAIISTTGKSLTADEVWTFTVGNNAACSLTGYDVLPDNYLSTTVGENVPYTAQLLANNVACGGVQPINCPTCTFAWSSSDITAVKFQAANLQSPIAQNVVPNIPPWIGFSNLNVVVDDGVNPPLSDPAQNSPFSISFPLNNNPIPFAQNPQPLGFTQCVNSAVSVEFTELMDINSLNNGFKVYEESAPGSPGCIDNPLLAVSYCEISGGIVTGLQNVDADPELETVAFFNPNGGLSANTTYRAMLNEAVVKSAAGMFLWAPVSPDPDINGDGAPDGYGWVFSTGANVCQIYRAEIIPGSDLFTCAANNNCPDDSNPGAANPGNQHAYSVIPYGIQGNALAAAGMNFNWSVSGALMGIDTATNLQSIEASPANDNGTEVLLASVDKPGEGSASQTANIRIFLCEDPWPGVGAIPWDEPSGLYNFSTYYCMNEDSATGTPLPFLAVPLAPNDPDGAGPILDEYIFVVNPLLARGDDGLGNFPLGTLAREVKSEAAEVKWWQKIADKFTGSAKSQLVINFPVTPQNLRTTEVGNDIRLDWTDPSTRFLLPDGWEISRQEVLGNGPWVILDANQQPRLPTSYLDTNVVAGKSYRYRVRARRFDAIVCNCIVYSPNYAQITFIPATPSNVDIIGIRVMANSDHLPPREWFQQNAPNATNVGSPTLVDGFPALANSATTYITAPNIVGGGTYTNMHIISHNLGARDDTVDIYRDLLKNLKFATNSGQAGSNLCSAPNQDISCSSDFDCPGTCDSNGLKLRRDLTRITDIFATRRFVEQYGQEHKSCDNNINISCTQNADCPAGGSCVPFYPLLSAGSFVPGLSNSTWPSWDQTLGLVLDESLSEDPINQFNGCPVDADPNTCWDEATRVFSCPQNSLVYVYNNIQPGDSYEIGMNFETGWFNSLLPFPVPSEVLLGLNGSYCNGANLNPPGPPAANYCGNGFTESYCSLPAYTNIGDCALNGGTWVSEECDGAFPLQDNMCAVTLGFVGWWNEQQVGCEPPGALDTSGVLVECKWHVPNPPLDAAQCGGRCGDNILQPQYELCENIGGVPDFNGVNYACAGLLTCAANACTPLCNGVPASACGDGVLDAAEECDASANPSGLEGWDCTLGGVVSCNTNTCLMQCSSGAPYLGQCGNGSVELPDEECDFASYITPLPQDTGALPLPAYTCTQQCDFVNQPFCGDGTSQYNFQELCDFDYSRPTADESSANKQYNCDIAVCRNDTPASGGWCGDGSIQVLASFGFCVGTNTACNVDADCTPPNLGACVEYKGEICEWGAGPDFYPAPVPGASDQANQYECNSDCLATESGGYCGDGITNDGGVGLNHSTDYGEFCDDGVIGDPNDSCDDNCQWTCWDGGGGTPAGPNIAQSQVLFNGLPDIVLFDGDTASMNLSHCRVSGDILVDVHAESGVATNLSTGVVLVSDKSGSMDFCMSNGQDPGGNCSDGVSLSLFSCFSVGATWTTNDCAATFGVPGDKTRMQALKEAITGPGGALDTIASVNPNAYLSHIFYDFIFPPNFLGPIVNDGTSATRQFYVLSNSVNVQNFKDWINPIPAVGGTNHLLALQTAKALFDEHEITNGWGFDNKVIIFMSDGESPQAIQALNYTRGTLEPDNIEVFTITLTNSTGRPLVAYMNGLSSSECICVGADCKGSQDFCGNAITHCASDNLQKFEECDGESGCDTNCQWEVGGKKRAYNSLDNPNLNLIYGDVMDAVPVGDVSIDIGNGFLDLGTPDANGNIFGAVIDAKYLNADNCYENSGPNNVVFEVNFVADQPGAFVTFDNGRYNYCPWDK